MSTTNKKFAYGSGEETSTDAYLHSVTGGEARGLHSVEMRDVSHARTAYSGDLYGQQDEEFTNSCSRIFVAVLSVFFVVVGVAIAVVGAVQKNKQILTLCPRCNDLIIVLYIVGGAMAGMGVIGLLACKTRMRPCAYLYTFLMIALALAFLAAGAAAVVYETGLKKFDTEPLWKDAIREDESFICQLQTTLNCSGYGRCCNAPNYRVRPANVTALDYMESALGALPGDTPTCEIPATSNSSAPPAPVSGNSTVTPLSEVCNPSCYISNANPRPCDEAVERDLKKYYIPIIGIGFGLSFVLLVGSVSSVRMTFKERAY